MRKTVYVLKRVDVDDDKVYVFKNKSALRKFIDKTINKNGGVYMQITVLFHSESEELEFFEKCREHNVIVRE